MGWDRRHTAATARHTQSKVCLCNKNTTGFCEEKHTPTPDRGGEVGEGAKLQNPHEQRRREREPAAGPPAELTQHDAGKAALPTLPALPERGRTPAPARSRGSLRAAAAPNLPQAGSGQHPEEPREPAPSGHRHAPLPDRLFPPARSRGDSPPPEPSPRLSAPPQATTEGRGLRESQRARLPPAARTPLRSQPPPPTGPGAHRAGRNCVTLGEEGAREPGRLGGRYGTEDRELRAGGRGRGTAQERRGTPGPSPLAAAGGAGADARRSGGRCRR